VVTRAHLAAPVHSDTDAVVPKLRPLDAKWTTVHGEPRLRLADPLHLSTQQAMLPAALAPLLGLLDGTRTLDRLTADYTRVTGAPISGTVVEEIVSALDGALFLQSERFEHALLQARTEFRAAPHRPPSLAGLSYPAEAPALEASFAAHGRRDRIVEALGPIRRASGVLSPHIDYARGGPIYAATWGASIEAAATCDVVVVFGTDHWGGAGQLTLTPQRYATPWGPLPTDPQLVDALADALGNTAYLEEIHHAREHSIELAAVWLHWALQQAGRAHRLPPVIPILCGSFHCYTHTGPHSPSPENHAPAHYPGQDLDEAIPPPLPESDPRLERALEAMVAGLKGARVLVVSAADLAHVGPAFGDATPLTDHAKRELAVADRCLLTAVEAGDATDFLTMLRADQDRTRICGLPPTYWTLRLLERLGGGHPRGRIVDYAQCPADPGFGSVVSIAGALWDERD
jgi:MEMO1 family protein